MENNFRGYVLPHRVYLRNLNVGRSLLSNLLRSVCVVGGRLYSDRRYILAL